jgi:hypothetical protein
LIWRKARKENQTFLQLHHSKVPLGKWIQNEYDKNEGFNVRIRAPTQDGTAEGTEAEKVKNRSIRETVTKDSSPKCWNQWRSQHSLEVWKASKFSYQSEISTWALKEWHVAPLPLATRKIMLLLYFTT